MLIKKIGFYCVMLCLLICITSCSDNSYNNPPDDTVAGKVEENYLDGNAQLSTSGTPFSEEEILLQTAAEMESGIIDTDCEIGNKGYYHFSVTKNYLDYNFLTLPITKNGKLYGEIALRRDEDGAVETAMVSFYGNDKLNELLESNPERKFAMVYAPMSEYAIMDDNTVYTISGFPPQINNGENLYNAYNLTDNILSYELIA